MSLIDITTNENKKIQLHIKHSLRDMYLKTIQDKEMNRKKEFEKKMVEEKDYIDKLNKKRLEQEEKALSDKRKIKSLIFNDYVKYNGLSNNYYSTIPNEEKEKNKYDLNNNKNEYFDMKYSNTSKTMNDLITMNDYEPYKKNNILAKSCILGNNNLNLPSITINHDSMKDISSKRKNNENNLSNKISRDYFRENKSLFDDKQVDFLKLKDRKDDNFHIKFGKRMNNFADMGQYYDTLMSGRNSPSEEERGKYLRKKEYNYVKPNVSIEKQPSYLGDSSLKQNPIINPVNYFDKEKYNKYLRFIAK